MPIYEYECQTCGIRFEKKQRVHDQPLSRCPGCGNQVRKVLHPVGIVFKGSGFYSTDYNRPKDSLVGGLSAKEPQKRPESKGVASTTEGGKEEK
ncbi:MAG: FmdB family zinc ribbon protein [Chloroflexota bacterium]